MKTKSSVKFKTQGLAAIIGLTVTLGLVGCGGDSATETNPEIIETQQPVSDWKMVWSDEFDGSAINSQNWTHEINCSGGGNQEKQCYTDSADNSYVLDGMLSIVALPAEEGATLPYTSARMITRYKADFKYGRMEIRAKLPSGQGSHPAFWMMPTDEEYGEWPHSGELDVLESVNLGADREDGSAEKHIYGTLHYGKSWPNNSQSGQAYMQDSGANPADDFHTYAVEWQEGEIRWYMDDYLYATQRQSVIRYDNEGNALALTHKGWFTEYYDQVTGELTTYWDSAPYDKDFYMILNFAVGGDWSENVNEKGVDATAFNASNKFEVDYVRVYQCQQNPDTGKGCETVRAAYDIEASDESPTGALVIGKAPNPVVNTPPVGGGLPDLVVFENEDTDFVAGHWAASGDIAVEDVDAGGTHGIVKQFTFNTDEGLGYFQSGNDTTDVSGYTSLEFDIFVVADNGATDFIIKMDCVHPCSSGDYVIEKPVQGVWTSYSIPLADLVGNTGSTLDLFGINTPLAFFPSWGTQAGFVAQIDNVRFTAPSTGEATLDVFSDADTGFVAGHWAASGDIAIEEVDLGDDHGTVKQFTFNTDEGLGYFQSTDTTDVSGYTSLEFDIFVVADNGATDFIVKMDCVHPCSSGDYVVEKPVEGVWTSYSILLTDLVGNSGSTLDLFGVNTPLAFFPTWGNQNGFVAQLDNVRFTAPAAVATLDVFSDTDTDFVAGFYAASGDIAIEEVDLGGDHGAVKQFTFNTDEGLGYFQSTDTTNVSGYTSIEFDIFVVADNGATDFIFKMDCVHPCSSGDYVIEKPAEGVWTSYSILLTDLVGNSGSTLDLFGVNTPMAFFPSWGTQAGFIAQIDNVRFK
jgi:beta-glucanase (GH16 family)